MISAGSSGAEIGGGRRRRLVEALVGDRQQRAVEAGVPDGVGVALVGDHRARLDEVHPRAQVLRPQLLGAGQRDRADPEAGHHRLDPLGPVPDHGHHHVAAADARARPACRPAAPSARRARRSVISRRLPSRRERPEAPCFERGAAVHNIRCEVHGESYESRQRLVTKLIKMRKIWGTGTTRRIACYGTGTPKPRTTRGAGDPGCWGEPPNRRRASSFSASPSANPAGVRKRLWSSRCDISLRASLCWRASWPACLPRRAPRRRRTGAPARDARYRPAEKAKIVNGYAIPPKSAPRRSSARSRPRTRSSASPTSYGGGHAPRVEDRGYDCSGTVSLRADRRGLLKTPLDSGSFMSWGRKGPGKWITVYANGGHAYVVIAGLGSTPACATRAARATARSPGSGPRWNKSMRDASGYRVRHPAGF